MTSKTSTKVLVGNPLLRRLSWGLNPLNSDLLFLQHILPGGFLAVNAFLMVAFLRLPSFLYSTYTGNQSQLNLSQIQVGTVFFPTLFMVLLVAAYIALFAPQLFL